MSWSDRAEGGSVEDDQQPHAGSDRRASRTGLMPAGNERAHVERGADTGATALRRGPRQLAVEGATGRRRSQLAQVGPASARCASWSCARQCRVGPQLIVELRPCLGSSIPGRRAGPAARRRLPSLKHRDQPAWVSASGSGRLLCRTWAERIGLGQAARGAGEVAHLARVDDHDRQRRCGQRRDQRSSTPPARSYQPAAMPPTMAESPRPRALRRWKLCQPSQGGSVCRTPVRLGSHVLPRRYRRYKGGSSHSDQIGLEMGSPPSAYGISPARGERGELRKGLFAEEAAEG